MTEWVWIKHFLGFDIGRNKYGYFVIKKNYGRFYKEYFFIKLWREL